MTLNRKIISSKKDWGTPKKYVDSIREFFGGEIDFDPCSNEYSIVKAKVECSLPDKDGLLETWDYSTIYVNPPYGIDKERKSKISDWLCKCEEAHRLFKSEVLALVPVATNTKHWKDYIFGRAMAVCFLSDTRLHFLINGHNGGKGAPMACAMIYWGTNYDNFYFVFNKFGKVIKLEQQDKKVSKRAIKNEN